MSAVDARLIVSQENITQLSVDAIVNAANSALCGGGGVDGAIHAAAGPQLLEECRTLGRCEAGDAVITRGYHLPAPWIIHTVGPVWYGGDRNEPELLASCYRRSLEIAQERDLSTIAFPAISCGAYRYPIEAATAIAVATCREVLSASEEPRTVSFVCFDPRVLQAYQQELGL